MEGLLLDSHKEVDLLTEILDALSVLFELDAYYELSDEQSVKYQVEIHGGFDALEKLLLVKDDNLTEKVTKMITQYFEHSYEDTNLQYQPDDIPLGGVNHHPDSTADITVPQSNTTQMFQI